MDKELQKAVQKFIISYVKLYFDELLFMAEILKNNPDAFTVPESLVDGLEFVAEDLESVLDAHFTAEILDETDKANFLVKLDDNIR
jgi:molecular chaperone GrpE (heat shock protein)